MTAFAMIAGRDAAGDPTCAAYTGTKSRIASMAAGFCEEEVKGPGYTAAKMWLSHSRTTGFARDESTGSWLACVGNPQSAAASSVPRESLSSWLLHSYLKNSKDAVVSLSAPFVVIIYDGRDGVINVVTDRLGLQRIYMVSRDGAVLFSTSSLALAASTPVTLDRRSLAVYFRSAFLLGTCTLFEEIRKVPAATWLTVRSEGVREKRYWEPPASQRDFGGDGAGVADAVFKTLDSALSADTPATVELTGGFDSRLNFAAAVKTGRHFTARTIADIDDRDTATARRLTALCGVEHSVVSPLEDIADSFDADLATIHRLSEGETDCLNVIASPSANRQSIKGPVQSVSGIGGEILRGAYYRSHSRAGLGVDLKRLVEWQLGLSNGYDHRLFKNCYADEGARLIIDVVREIIAEDKSCDAWHQLEHLYAFGPLQGSGGCSVTFNNFFYRQIVPFCSNALLDVAFLLDPSLKKSGLAMRRAIARLSPKIADVPLAIGLPARPLRARDAPALLKSSILFGARVARKAGAKLRLLKAGRSTGRKLAERVNDSLTALCRRELVIDRMASAPLYRPDALSTFLSRNIEGGFPDRTQIGLMLSTELTFRYVGGNLRLG